MPRFLRRINHILIFTLISSGCIPVPVAKANTDNVMIVDAQAQCKLSSEGWVMECDDHLQESLEKNAQKLCSEQQKASLVKIIKKRTCVPKGQLHICKIQALFRCK